MKDHPGRSVLHRAIEDARSSPGAQEILRAMAPEDVAAVMVEMAAKDITVTPDTIRATAHRLREVAVALNAIAAKREREAS